MSTVQDVKKIKLYIKLYIETTSWLIQMPARKSAHQKPKPSKDGHRIRETQTTKAGLVMPVGRVQRYLREGHFAERTQKLSGVYLSAVLEYLVAEVLELAGNEALQENRSTISPRHILLAVKNDDCLDELLQTVIIARGGVKPRIHPALMPAKSQKHKKK